MERVTKYILLRRRYPDAISNSYVVCPALLDCSLPLVQRDLAGFMGSLKC